MFTLKNYPKSYGNIRIGFYRLEEFQKLGANLKQVESELWNFISRIAASRQPRKVFKSYTFLNAGWEWSVFLKDKKTVIKIPAEIFPEVNKELYLINTKFAYRKILEYFPAEFVAKTTFTRVNGLNIQEQELIVGEHNEIIGHNTKKPQLLQNLESFLSSAIKMLDEYQWLPDFDIQQIPKGFRLRNVIIQSDLPKIIDFTAYYDIYRLYPKRTKEETKNKRKALVGFLHWVNKRKKSKIVPYNL